MQRQRPRRAFAAWSPRGARTIALSDRGVGELPREQRGGEAVRRDPPSGAVPHSGPEGCSSSSKPRAPGWQGSSDCLCALPQPQPELFTSPRPLCPLTSSHGTPAHPVPGGPGGPSSGPGPGLPRVRLQWRELLQPHALPGHGHLLHDHAYLLHPDQDEGEQVLRAQLLRDRV